MDLKELRNYRNEIIEQYDNGLTFEELKIMYSTTWSNIYSIISVKFEHTYSNITNREKEEIVKMYIQDGLSTTQIGEKLKIYHKLISDVLSENKIERIGNNKRKYSLNEHYFDDINTPNKAYILGFFYADGCNIMNKSTVAMSLEEKDKEILEKIRLEIDSERKLEFIEQSKRKDKNNNYHYKDMWRLLLFSSHMCRTLNDLGMMPNKSLKLKFPEWLNKNLYSHFIRGYFDGDGSLSLYQKTNGKYQVLLTLTSTNDFCQECLNILRDELNVGGGIYDASSHNGITKVLSFSGFVQVNKILEWMYEDADLYMKRKYDNYVNNFKSARIINNPHAA